MKVLINSYAECKSLLVEVNNLKEASEIVKIETEEQRSSEWYCIRNVGNIYNGKKVIAHVSYNGRVWEVDKNGKFTDVEIEV